ncbi:hypothetical protein RMSM_03579 [Rhodopirellula maiorica SM1]|uniref:Uncharacterized protein n=1 Tax=Rhodopirellula maiorica SM1 TaxID=1265738 RepID=M5RZZ1_9BACT|nr:hypothetical protein RMSM_03579 [Rhodopirellula maiorica SM1]
MLRHGVRQRDNATRGDRTVSAPNSKFGLGIRSILVPSSRRFGSAAGILFAAMVGRVFFAAICRDFATEIQPRMNRIEGIMVPEIADAVERLPGKKSFVVFWSFWGRQRDRFR